MSRVIAQPHVGSVFLTEQETLRPSPQLTYRLYGGLQDLWRIVRVSSEMLSSGQIAQVARKLIVDVWPDVVVIAKGLRLEAIVVGVAVAHV